jgi:uncharacterized membrane protein
VTQVTAAYNEVAPEYVEKEAAMSTNTLTHGLWIAGIGLGVGAAATYFGNPKRGARRRAALARGTEHLCERATGEVRRSLLDAQHHLTGISARLSSSLTAANPPEQVLEARIRSRIGRVLSQPRKVHVVCDRGLVTLWGGVPENEIYELLRVVRDVPGVKDIQEHLDTYEQEFQHHDLDSLNHARRESRLNWSPARRMLVGSAGAALAVYGLRRKEGIGKAATVAGAGLVAYSMLHNDLSSTLALTELSPGFELEKTIHISAPISDVFDFWANPVNYPKAFSHVAGIERLGENLYRWKLIGPAGIFLTWEGVITRTVPNTLVEWKSLPGSTIGNFGVARFDPVYDGSTRLQLRMFYRPPAGILGRFVAEFLGSDPATILDHDLNRLRELFERGELPGPSAHTPLKKLRAWRATSADRI